MIDWFIITISLLSSLFFSAMELAFVAASKIHINSENNNSRLSANILSIFKKNADQYIVTMLIGNAIALVLYGIYFSSIIKSYFLYAIPNVPNTGTVLIFQIILASIVIIITSELLPKAFLKNNPTMSLNIFAIPIFIIYILLYPFTKLVILVSKIVTRVFLGTKNIDSPFRQKVHCNDLTNFIYSSNHKQLNKKKENHNINIFRKAMDFSAVKVRECMIPRTEIVALNITDKIETLKQQFVDSGLSKILIYEETIDRIIGFVHHSDLFTEPVDIKSLVREVPIVPETLSAQKLLSIFLKNHNSIAVVVDEFGGTAGIVTTEDIIEEIFGEIQDEHDSTKFEEKQISETEFIFSARLEIDYLNEKYGINLPSSDDYETLAGLILFHYENIPRLNEVIEIGNFKCTILEVSTKRIDLLHILINNTNSK